MNSSGYIYEDTDQVFQCEATGGVPDPVSMLWYMDEQPVASCANLTLTTTCVMHITRADHERTVRCQEFQIDYQEGGWAEQTLNVLCRFLQF